jgi:hypothetical protein
MRTTLSKKHRMPKAMEDLTRHTMIRFDRDTASLRALGGGGLPITRAERDVGMDPASRGQRCD